MMQPSTDGWLDPITKMTSPDKGRPRIVLADDHPAVLAGFARLLRSCDVVGLVSNGHDAIEAAARVRPDVLVVDLTMHDLNGLEICRRVKDTVPGTEVVIVTAFDDTEVGAAALQAGASAFIPKHSAAATLETTIQRIFENRNR